MTELMKWLKENEPEAFEYVEGLKDWDGILKNRNATELSRLLWWDETGHGYGYWDGIDNSYEDYIEGKLLPLASTGAPCPPCKPTQPDNKKECEHRFIKPAIGLEYPHKAKTICADCGEEIEPSVFEGRIEKKQPDNATILAAIEKLTTEVQGLKKKDDKARIKDLLLDFDICEHCRCGLTHEEGCQCTNDE